MPKRSRFSIKCLYKAHIWLLPVSLEKVSFLIGKLHGQLIHQAGFPNSLEIYFVDDKKISHCNLVFFNCTSPTNILSFPATDEIPGVLLLSLDTYNRECALYNQESLNYLFTLLTHGLAHLSGLDHGEKFDIFQKRCMEIIGL